MSDPNRFCLIPESGLNVSPDGYVTPCCVTAHPKLGHISKNSLGEIFSGPEYSEFRNNHRNNTLPQVCIDSCVNKNNNFVHVESRKEMTLSAEHYGRKPFNKEKFIHLDVGLGNLCNLTCTFCNEKWSSSWAKLKNKSDQIFYYDLETTLRIARDLKDMLFISFKGGEPLNIPHLDKFLEELYLYNPRCIISLVTNATDTNDKLNRALFSFNTSISVSVEATGKLYQYLRGGKHTWEDVSKNIKTFHDISQKNKFSLGISSLILLYNYTTWAEDMFKIQQEIGDYYIIPNVSTQLCVYPEDQSLFLLNRSQRQRLVDSIQHYVSRGLRVHGVDAMINSIMADRPVSTTREKVMATIDFNNKMRGMNLFDIVEDFTPHLVL